MAKQTQTGNNGNQDLGAQLQKDAAQNQVRAFHDHVYRALANGATDKQIKAAIESAKDLIKADWEAEQAAGKGAPNNPWPGIEAFEENELETARFRQLIEIL